MASRPIDTAQLGPIRIDHDEISRKRGRAGDLLDRYCPEGVIAQSKDERRKWHLDAMIAFANEEVRRDRELRRG